MNDLVAIDTETISKAVNPKVSAEQAQELLKAGKIDEELNAAEFDAQNKAGVFFGQDAQGIVATRTALVMRTADRWRHEMDRLLRSKKDSKVLAAMRLLKILSDTEASLAQTILKASEITSARSTRIDQKQRMPDLTNPQLRMNGNNNTVLVLQPPKPVEPKPS
jgi:hypothetical protein